MTYELDYRETVICLFILFRERTDWIEVFTVIRTRIGYKLE